MQPQASHSRFSGRISSSSPSAVTSELAAMRDAEADQQDAERRRQKARPHVHQGAEPIARPLQGHNEPEQNHQAAGVKVLFTHEPFDQPRRAVLAMGTQSTSSRFLLERLTLALSIKGPPEHNQSLIPARLFSQCNLRKMVVSTIAFLNTLRRRPHTAIGPPRDAAAPVSRQPCGGPSPRRPPPARRPHCAPAPGAAAGGRGAIGYGAPSCSDTAHGSRRAPPAALHHRHRLRRVRGAGAAYRADGAGVWHGQGAARRRLAAPRCNSSRRWPGGRSPRRASPAAGRPAPT